MSWMRHSKKNEHLLNKPAQAQRLLTASHKLSCRWSENIRDTSWRLGSTRCKRVRCQSSSRLPRDPTRQSGCPCRITPSLEQWATRSPCEPTQAHEKE